MTNEQKIFLRSLVVNSSDADLQDLRDQMEATADGTKDPETTITLLFLACAEQMNRAKYRKVFLPDGIPF